MKRVAELFLVALSALLLTSCGKSFKDMEITSCKITSISPKGLSAFDATVDLGVNNPSVQLNLTKLKATVKMDGAPCLYLNADDVTIEPRSEQVYVLTIHGLLDGSFNPFALLTLLDSPDLEPMTIDASCHAALKSGIGKDLIYEDVPLKDLLGKI
ncbi:MAG: hypothetical protein J5640_07495 [Bacteroidales bacterium]|nr:hypothetical protein [Bacteroidales bacterium]